MDSLFGDPVNMRVIKCDLVRCSWFVDFYFFKTLQNWFPTSTWGIGNQPISQHYIKHRGNSPGHSLGSGWTR